MFWTFISSHSAGALRIEICTFGSLKAKKQKKKKETNKLRRRSRFVQYYYKEKKCGLQLQLIIVKINTLKFSIYLNWTHYSFSIT